MSAWFTLYWISALLVTALANAWLFARATGAGTSFSRQIETHDLAGALASGACRALRPAEWQGHDYSSLNFAGRHVRPALFSFLERQRFLASNLIAALVHSKSLSISRLTDGSRTIGKAFAYVQKVFGRGAKND